MEQDRAWPRRLLDGLYLAGGVLSGVFLVVILLLMMGLSLGREVGIDIPSGDDFAAWSMAAMAFLGLAYTFKSGEMIRVGLLIDRLEPGSRRIVEIVCLALAACLVGYFAWYVTSMTYDSWRFNDISQGVVPVPLWMPQSAVAAGAILFLIAIVDEFFRVLAGLRPTYDKGVPKTPEEVIQRALEGGA